MSSLWLIFNLTCSIIIRQALQYCSHFSKILIHTFSGCICQNFLNSGKYIHLNQSCQFQTSDQEKSLRLCICKWAGKLQNFSKYVLQFLFTTQFSNYSLQCCFRYNTECISKMYICQTPSFNMMNGQIFVENTNSNLDKT